MSKGKIVFKVGGEFNFDPDLYEVDAATDRNWIYLRRRPNLTEAQQAKLEQTGYMFRENLVDRIEY